MGMISQMKPNPPHFWGQISRWLLITCFAGGLLASCSKDGGSSAGDASVDLDGEREAVAEARSDAKKAEAPKYAREDFDKAVDYEEKAEDYASQDGGAENAKRTFRMAVRKFEQAKKSAESNKKKFAVAEDIKKKFDELLAAKEEAKLPLMEVDGAGLAEAKARYTEGEEFLADGKLSEAKHRFNSALSTLTSSISRVENRLANKQKSELARQQMEAAREQALTANATEKAPGDLAYANNQATMGQQQFDQGEYDLASNYFTVAASYFNTAFARASGAPDLPADGDNGGVATDLNGNPRETYRPAPEIERVEPPTPGPDDLAADGIEWLLNNMHGSPEYENGFLSLSYSIGQGADLQKDVIQKLGSKTTHFEGTEGVGTDSYVIAGNSKAYVLLKPVFRDQVRMEVSFQSQLNVHPATFQLVLMSDPKSQNKSYYGSHYGTDVRITSGTKGQNRTPSANKDFHGNNVNNWLQRREPIKMVFEYNKKTEEEKGVLRVFHDGEEVCRYETDFLRSGQVGFLWDNAKWYINDLKVKGRLDQEWLKEVATTTAKKDEGGDDAGGDFGF